MSKELSSKVKHFRTSRGLTKKELAEMMGITTTTLKLIEDNPRHEIQKRTALKVWKAIGSNAKRTISSKPEKVAAKKVAAKKVQPKQSTESELLKNVRAAKEALDVVLNTSIKVSDIGNLADNNVESWRVASVRLGFVLDDLSI